jgi:hypothetical protein
MNRWWKIDTMLCTDTKLMCDYCNKVHILMYKMKFPIIFIFNHTARCSLAAYPGTKLKI